MSRTDEWYNLCCKAAERGGISIEEVYRCLAEDSAYLQISVTVDAKHVVELKHRTGDYDRKLELVARAICEAERMNPDDPLGGWRHWKDAARAAIHVLTSRNANGRT